MGRAKWKLMEDEERGFVVDDEKWVCADEFPHQSELREAIGRSFEGHVCSYCGEEKQVISLKEVVERVHDAMEEVYEDPADSLPFESGSDTWGDLEGTGLHKEGAGYVLRDGFHIMTTYEALEEVDFNPRSEALLDDISESINQGWWVYKDLIESTDDERLQYNWDTFWSNTIGEARAGKNYDEIKRDNAVYLGYMQEALVRNLHALKKTLRKGQELYRCVRYKNVPDPLDAPSLWAPPADKASAQRMSKKGQSRFYASFDADTPLKEAVTNTADETACLGIFELTKTIEVLDFTDLPEARLLNCPDVLAYRFFNRFADAITRPVGDDEKEKYVPTQIMRDIIEDSFKQAGIMGIKYDSVKGTASTNVVLFLDDKGCPAYLSLQSTRQYPPNSPARRADNPVNLR